MKYEMIRAINIIYQVFCRSFFMKFSTEYEILQPNSYVERIYLIRIFAEYLYQIVFLFVYIVIVEKMLETRYKSLWKSRATLRYRYEVTIRLHRNIINISLRNRKNNHRYTGIKYRKASTWHTQTNFDSISYIRAPS